MQRPITGLVAVLAGLVLPVVAGGQAFDVETVTDQLTPLEATTGTHPGDPPLDLIVTISDDGSGAGNRLDAFRLPGGEAAAAAQTPLASTPNVFGLSHRLAHDPVDPSPAPGVAGAPARGTGQSYVSLIDDFQLVVWRTADGVTWERRPVGSLADLHTSSEVGIVASGLVVAGYNAATFAIDVFRSRDGAETFELLGSVDGTTLLVDIIYGGYRMALATRPDSDQFGLLYSQTGSIAGSLTAPARSTPLANPSTGASWSVARASAGEGRVVAPQLTPGTSLTLYLALLAAEPGLPRVNGTIIPGDFESVDFPYFLETVLVFNSIQNGSFAAMYAGLDPATQEVAQFVAVGLLMPEFASASAHVLGAAPSAEPGFGIGSLGAENDVVHTLTLGADATPFLEALLFPGYLNLFGLPEDVVPLRPDGLWRLPFGGGSVSLPASTLPLDLPGIDPSESVLDEILHVLVIASLEKVTFRGCVDTETVLCNQNNRFDVRASWRDHQGNTGSGRARPLTGDSGTFWFFDEANVELLVKVLDACAVNGHAWVFAGGLTDVEVDLVVTDRFTGAQKAYHNPAGRTFEPIQDTAAFAGVCPLAEGGAAGAGLTAASHPGPGVAATAAAPPSVTETATHHGACVPGPTALCLADGRFRVEVDWNTSQGTSGAGQAVPLTTDSGVFWFFASDNLELVVKVLDACVVNDHFWFFTAGLTNVGLSITVTDTSTGAQRTYHNDSGTAFESVLDTAAFAVCS